MWFLLCLLILKLLLLQIPCNLTTYLETACFALFLFFLFLLFCYNKKKMLHVMPPINIASVNIGVHASFGIEFFVFFFFPENCPGVGHMVIKFLVF